MAKIKLFSGMDFSGKTTIINKINEEIPNAFKLKDGTYLKEIYMQKKLSSSSLSQGTI